jgi:hypothetical protein
MKEYGGIGPWISSVWVSALRVRILLIRIRIQHFRLNTDPDPFRIKGFYD